MIRCMMCVCGRVCSLKGIADIFKLQRVVLKLAAAGTGQAQLSLDSPLAAPLRTPWFPERCLKSCIDGKTWYWVPVFFLGWFSRSQNHVMILGNLLGKWFLFFIVKTKHSLIPTYANWPHVTFTTPSVARAQALSRKPLPERLVRLGHCMLVPALGASKHDDQLALGFKVEEGSDGLGGLLRHPEDVGRRSFAITMALERDI